MFPAIQLEEDCHTVAPFIIVRNRRNGLGAYSLMCAYNRIGGKAACANDVLERDILRGEWKFPGYIVSDCGAIDNIYLRHKVAGTAAAAAAIAVKTGTDLDCGRVYPNLVDAVSQGLITESQIDTSVQRLFLARMKLGMFDLPEHVRWASIPLSVLDQPSHRALALQVARESMVLLKNAGGTLPLRKSLGTIAVIGPNADAGKRYALRIEAEETYGDASLQFVASVPHETLAAEAEGAARQADAVVMVMGLTARLEGEEMPVAIEGFRGGDRTRIDLPAAQERLLKRITALGKPTVLVLLNGSAVAVNWAQDHVPAIVEGWYPGQAGGTALADVLFGDYNPAGRLPVTFYRDTTDLPPFNNYDMAGRTYRYFAGKPLYAFGHGLSYTTFRYSGLRTNTVSLSPRGAITVTVDVTDTGKRAGDEVVQLYARHIGSKLTRPNRDLRGFRRIALEPGQKRSVSFSVPASSLAWWNAATHAWKVEADTIAFEVGASSADIRATRKVRVKL